MAQGDKAAARVTFRGTQRGEFQGIPATGKSFSMAAIGILRFEAGKVVEHWAVLDLLGLLTQLGVAPAQHELPYSVLWPAQHGSSSNAGNPDANLAVVRRFFAEVCNGRRLAVANDLYAAITATTIRPSPT